MTDKARKKQTEATLLSVCESLRSGISFTRSCSVSGISKQTGFAWRNAGWDAIDSEDADSDEPISFTARFALETELALADFQRPLIQRIRDGADGKSKGDWRAAQQLLASRFPDEFSEKVAAAKSGKLEVSGQIAMEHQHGYREFLNLRNMTRGELALEMARLESQVDHTPISGCDLDVQIGILEGKLDSMRLAREGDHDWLACNWIGAGLPAIRPALPEAIDLDESEFSELPAVPAAGGPGAATTGLAPDTGAGVVLAASAPVASSSEIARSRVQTGIGFDRDSGLAIPIFEDDEDLGL